MSGGQVSLSVVNPRLDVLARMIRSKCNLARSHTLGFYRNMLETGEAANEAKGIIPRGEFTPWIEETCGMRERAAWRWRKVAETGMTAEEVVEAGGLVAVLESLKLPPGETDIMSVSEAPDTHLLEAGDPETRAAVVVAAETQWAGEKPKQKLHTGLRPEERPATPTEKLKQRIADVELEVDILRQEGADVVLAKENADLRQQLADALKRIAELETIAARVSALEGRLKEAGQQA